MKAYKNDNSGAIIVRLGKSKYNLHLIAIDYFDYQTSDIYTITTNKYFYHNVKKFALRILRKRFKYNSWYKDKSICWSDAYNFYNNIRENFSELHKHNYEEHNRAIIEQKRNEDLENV